MKLILFGRIAQNIPHVNKVNKKKNCKLCERLKKFGTKFGGQMNHVILYINYFCFKIALL